MKDESNVVALEMRRSKCSPGVTGEGGTGGTGVELAKLAAASARLDAASAAASVMDCATSSITAKEPWGLKSVYC